MCWAKMDDRHLREELLGMLFCYATILVVPATPLEEKPTNKCTVFGHLNIKTLFLGLDPAKHFFFVVSWVGFVSKFKLELKRIDFNAVLPGIVL